jgi:uncharacterized protein (TIGR00297 family)
MTQAEWRRQIVHIAMGGFAFALRSLTWGEAAACALAAVLFNVFVLPRLASRLFRGGEIERRLGGIVFYPLSVLLLIVTFPDRPDIAALGWGVLAAGDGAATIAGRAIGGARLPWNRDKTWVGTVSFVLAAGVAGTVLAWWTWPAVTPRPPTWFVWTAPWVAAVAAALVESLPIGLDDNLSVPAVAGAAAWTAAVISPDAVVTASALLLARLAPALIVNAIAALAGFRAGSVNGAGAWVGFAVGLIVWLGAGIEGWLLLLTSFLVVVAATRAGLERKMVLGIAEARGGRRGPANTLANCGLAAIAALLVLWSTNPGLALLVFVTALTTGASDTVASEIGKAYGRTTWLVTSFRRVPAGTPGALSVEGTLAGVAAALFLAALGATVLRLVPPAWLWVVVASATVGSFVESVLGATLEASGVLDNDVLNFLNTAVASLLAVALARSVT